MVVSRARGDKYVPIYSPCWDLIGKCRKSHISIWARAICRRFQKGLLGSNRDTPPDTRFFPMFLWKIIVFLHFLALSGLVGGWRAGRARSKRDAPIYFLLNIYLILEGCRITEHSFLTPVTGKKIKARKKMFRTFKKIHWTSILAPSA